MIQSVLDTHFLGRLISASKLVEQHTNLEAALTALAEQTAELIRADRCSILLRSDSGDGDQEAELRIFAHFGPLPPEALRETVRLSKGIAGHVMATCKPLLVADVTQSPFVECARFRDSANPSLISAPIEVASQLIGVINVSGPGDGPRFTERDLDLIVVFAAFIGQSIQIFQLQKLAESRVLQLAILREQQQSGSEALHRPIAPDPGRVAKLVAKSLYRELTAAGFGANGVIAVMSEVLGQLHGELKRENHSNQ